MKFVLKELVELKPEKAGGGASCIFEGCVQQFKTARKDVIKKQYERAHKATFLDEVSCKPANRRSSPK